MVPPLNFVPAANLPGLPGVGGIVPDDFQYNAIRPVSPSPLPPTMGAWEMCKVIIQNQPDNVEICAGNNASFTVTAIGSPDLSYLWQVSTDNGATWTSLVDGAPYSGVLTNTLNITGATAAMNNYQYRCAVTTTVVANGCTKTVNSLAGILTVNGSVTGPIWHQ